MKGRGYKGWEGGQDRIKGKGKRKGKKGDRKRKGKGKIISNLE